MGVHRKTVLSALAFLACFATGPKALFAAELAAAPATNGVNSAAAPEVDSASPPPTQIDSLHRAWQAEHDPVKRRERADELLEALIHVQNQEAADDVAAEVARDGRPVNVLLPAGPAAAITLKPILVLPNVHRNLVNAPGVPVFRRMAANRFEVWTPKEGWLFDRNGRVLVDAHPRRGDGTGRDWFGAFLPDGQWITTDLLAEDHTLTCFDAHSRLRWELSAKKIVQEIDAAHPPQFASDIPFQSIGWARTDRSGKAWLVALGFDWTRGFALIAPSRHVRPLSTDAKLWQLVYPRSMAVRGGGVNLFIDSDDGLVSFSREEAPHGPGVGWPTYRVTGATRDVDAFQGQATLDLTIQHGGIAFGFWPGRHDVYVEVGWDSPAVWFFGENGSYEGQTDGAFLGDAANGRDLLTQASDGSVETLQCGTSGLRVTASRSFTWPDGTPAVPLALYDDLRLGFFLRGSNLVGASYDNRAARGAAEIVLARW